MFLLNYVKKGLKTKNIQNEKLNRSINYKRSSLPALFSEIEESTSSLNISSLDNNWNHCTFLLLLILNDPVGLGDIRCICGVRVSLLWRSSNDSPYSSNDTP